jgi:hypothetical protein
MCWSEGIWGPMPRKDWNDRYHSRSQWVCGTMWTLRLVPGAAETGSLGVVT